MGGRRKDLREKKATPPRKDQGTGRHRVCLKDRRPHGARAAMLASTFHHKRWDSCFHCGSKGHCPGQRPYKAPLKTKGAQAALADVAKDASAGQEQFRGTATACSTPGATHVLLPAGRRQRHGPSACWAAGESTEGLIWYMGGGLRTASRAKFDSLCAARRTLGFRGQHMKKGTRISVVGSRRSARWLGPWISRDGRQRAKRRQGSTATRCASASGVDTSISRGAVQRASLRQADGPVVRHHSFVCEATEFHVMHMELSGPHEIADHKHGKSVTYAVAAVRPSCKIRHIGRHCCCHGPGRCARRFNLKSSKLQNPSCARSPRCRSREQHSKVVRCVCKQMKRRSLAHTCTQRMHTPIDCDSGEVRGSHEDNRPKDAGLSHVGQELLASGPQAGSSSSVKVKLDSSADEKKEPKD